MKLRAISAFGDIALIANYQYNSTVLHIRELKSNIEILLDERTTDNPLLRFGDCSITVNEYGEVFCNKSCACFEVTNSTPFSVKFKVRCEVGAFEVEVTYEPFENYELAVSVNGEGVGLFVAVIFDMRKQGV